MFAERCRIERALHDGAEQDLISICVRLQLLRELVEASPADALAQIENICREAADALDRLRTLASDIYPAVLAARGLPDALRSIGGVRVEIGDLGRYPAEVEAAVYFVCRSVVGRDGATVRVRGEPLFLELEIVATGEIDVAEPRDLVAALGGTLTVGGKRVVARFPLGD